MRSLLIILLCCNLIMFVGCVNEKASMPIATMTEYEFPSEAKRYNIRDFDCVSVGKTTMSELYEIVGEAECYSVLTLRMEFIYLLEDGRYLVMICEDYQLEGGELDYTIDEMKLMYENPLNN